MKKKFILPAVIFVLLIFLLLYSRRDAKETREILVNVSTGRFVVDVTTTGELSAMRSVRILGPSRGQTYRIYQFKIEHLVEEGTVVKKGQQVATLDKSELHTRLSDAATNLEKARSQYDQTRLDTAIDLRGEREKIINLRYTLQETQLVLEQSKFEPPATIKQNEIAEEKARRALDQGVDNYELKKKQAIAKMQGSSATLRKEETDHQALQTLQAEFNILAPQDGMVIYSKDWNGNKISTGSQIGAWDPVVATLPDLTEMVSVTFVNEVDIRKVAVGQKVNIGLDAYPEKKLSGEVTKVANIGQQNPNSDAKVFEVTVHVNERDPSLRPAMTTSNNIMVAQIDSVVFVPLEAIYSRHDSIEYVVLSDGSLQEIEMGLTNSNEAVVLQGLQGSEKVYLSMPEGTNNKEIKLLPSLNGKRNKEKETPVAVASTSSNSAASTPNQP